MKKPRLSTPKEPSLLAGLGPTGRSGGTILSLSLSMLLSSLGTSIANVALPTLAREFSAAFTEVQWVVLVYLLAVTALIVGAGRLGDFLGRRRLLLIGLALFALGSALCTASPTIEFLIAARFIQGAGAATMMVLTLALVTEAVPQESTGRAMGLLGTTSALGTALGPTLGGLLIATFGWRAIFLVQVPLSLMALFLTRRHLPPDPVRSSAQEASFDLAGTALLALTLSAYALGLTLGRGQFRALNAGLLALAVLGFLLFRVVEKNARFPLVPWEGFQNPTLSAGLTLSGLVSTVLMATLVVGPFYLSRALDLDATQVGLAMSVGPCVAALSGVPAGKLVDRWGPARAAAWGLSGIFFGCSILAILPLACRIAGYLTPLAVVTAGYALFQTANNTSVMKSVQRGERGVSSGLLNLSRNLGLITGASAMATLFATLSGATDVMMAAPEAVSRAMRGTFGAASALVAIALGIQLMKKKPSANELGSPGLSG